MGVRILYATVTGTAEDVAKALYQRLLALNVAVHGILPVDAYDVTSLMRDSSPDTIFVFIVATAGDGEAPATMLRCWTSLRRASLRRNALDGMRAAVFGLGDRAYPKFNAAGRRLATRLGDLGADLVVPLGLGDDGASGSYEATLRPWMLGLARVCAPACTDVELTRPLPPPEPTLKLHVAADAVELKESSLNENRKWAPELVRRKRVLPGSGTVNVLPTVIISNRLLTNAEELREEREVREISLDVSSSAMSYVPGDVVNVLARNRPSAVNAFMQLTGLNGSSQIDVLPRDASMEGANDPCGRLNVQLPCSLADFVASQLDLSGTPRRRFLERLAHFATDGQQKDKLLELASPEGADDYAQYAQRECRTILMVLRDFPSARPPLEHLVDMIPALQPRAFSLASSLEGDGQVLKVCAAMVKYKTPLRFMRTGVCSSFWMSGDAGDCVPIFLQPGTLRFERDRPAIMVGPGTGVAPMRSYVSSLTPGPGVSSSGLPRVLFFGCRHEKGDFLYESEWDTAVQEGRLTRVEAAFSRDQAKKSYVQDKIDSCSAELWQLLNTTGQGVVYIAGAAGNMPKGVRLSLVNMATKEGGLSETQAEMYVKRLERSKRLQIECW